MKKNNYYPSREVEVEIPNVLPSNTDIEYLDEDDLEDVQTYRSIKEAVGQNGYVDLSKEIMANTTIALENPNKKDITFFDLRNDANEVAENINKAIGKSNEDKKSEKKKEWKTLLSSMNSREDEYAVCSNLSGDIIFEVLLDTMKNIDEVYAKFTKSPLKFERHKELLDEVMNDLIEEEKTIDEYREALKKLG